MEYVLLSDVGSFSDERISIGHVTVDNYISTENMVPNKGGVIQASSLPDAKKVSKYNPGDILLSNIRPYFKKIWFADCIGGCSNDVLVFHPNKDIDAKFLYYVLSDNNFFNYATLTSKGTKMPRGTKRAILKYWIPNLSLATQQKIASLLSAYDSQIENNQKRIKLLEQMAENLYKEWFVRFRFPGFENAEFEGGVPKGWKLERLEDFGIVLETGSRPKGGIDSSVETGVPSLGAEAINGLAEFDYNSLKLVPQDYYDKMKRGKSKGNHILVYKDGAYIGKVTIFRNGFPFKEYSINEHVFFLNTKDCDYQNYLYFTLHQKAFFSLMKNLNRNAAQPGLSQQDMNGIKVFKPTKDVVNTFNQYAEPIFNEVFSLAKENRLLTHQRDLLLPRLMSGKLSI